MKRQYLLFFVVLMFAVGANAATITVAQDGSGNATSVQAALLAASNGDEIVIQDSAVYEEDVTAGVAAGLVASFTLRAADGQTPTIRATNSTERLAALGIPGSDFMGTLLFGCQGVVIDGITFENLDTGVNAGSIGSALTCFDTSSITIRNCTVRGAGGPGTGYQGDNIGVLLGGIQTAPTDMVVEDCHLIDHHIAVAIAKFVGGTPTDPSAIVRRCTIENCNGTGIEIDNGAPPNNTDAAVATGEGNLLEDNLLINCDAGIQLGGGYNVIRNCTVLGSLTEGFDVDLDGDRGTQPITGILENCDFIGSIGDGVRVDEGIVTLDNCIIAGSASEGIHVRNADNESTVTVTNCDVYQNNKDGLSFEVRVDPTTSVLIQLNLINTNVVSEYGIYNGDIDDASSFDEEACFADYCNVFVGSDRYTNVAVTNDHDFDPQYVNPSADPDTFTREGFYLAEGSPAASAGQGGTFIGALGVATGLQNWMMY